METSANVKKEEDNVKKEEDNVKKEGDNVKKEEDNMKKEEDESLIETETPTASIQLFLLKQEPAEKSSVEKQPETKKDAAEEDELGDDLPSAMRFVQQRYNDILKSDQLATLNE